MPQPPSHVLTVGVTGSIGSGKTEVCKILRELGASVFFADEMAKELMVNVPALRKALTKTFGQMVFTPQGELNREYLADIVFANDAEREKLNAIVHPYVLERMKNVIRDVGSSKENRLLIFEAALLFEAGADEMCDYVIVVDARESTRIPRIVERDRTTAEHVRQRIRAQMPVEEKSNRADFVIHNDGDREKLRETVMFLHRILTAIMNSRVSVSGH